MFCLAGACGSVPETPEERLRAVLHDAEEAARARELAPLRELVADDYADRYGNGKRELVRYLAGLFLRHDAIHLLTRIRALEVEPGRARAEVLAALAGRAVDLETLSADLYRFEFQFLEVEGAWRLREAAWRPATRDDFL